jgi:hypothetical protein
MDSIFRDKPELLTEAIIAYSRGELFTTSAADKVDAETLVPEDDEHDAAMRLDPTQMNVDVDVRYEAEALINLQLGGLQA